MGADEKRLTLNGRLEKRTSADISGHRRGPGLTLSGTRLLARRCRKTNLASQNGVCGTR
jgi:hypothetical protein